jgi:hypothetical protein
MIGMTSLAKLTVVPPAAGSVAGASVAAGGSVGAAVSVEAGASVGGSVAGADVSVGWDVGASVAGVPQAASNPTIKRNKAILTYVDFIFCILLKKI